MSRTGNGALIALNAIGKQDQILYDLDQFDKNNSPFFHEHSQFGHYTKFYKSYVREPSSPSTTWPFTGDGEKVGFIIDPRTSGDLLTNVFLKLTIPAIQDNGMWTDRIGRAIIKSVEFRVDTIVVDKLTDLDLVIKDEMFTTDYDKTVKNYTENGKLYKNSLIEENLLENPNVLPLSTSYNKQLDLYVNLDFCFSKNNRYKCLPFPIAAVFNQLVYVDIQFRNKEWFTNTGTDIGVDKLTLVTEQVTLNEPERLFVQRNPSTFTYKSIKNMLTVQTDLDSDTFSQTGQTSGSKNTPFNVQLKNNEKNHSIFWTFRNRRFTSLSSSDSVNSNLFLNRYNFSSHENFNVINPLDLGYTGSFYSFNEKDFPICSKLQLLYPKNDLSLLYAGDDNSTIPSTSVFFRDIYSQSKGFFTPERNIFSYNFDENPLAPEPSKNYKENTSDYKLSISLINTEDVISNVYDVYIFTYYSFDLNFENGFLLKKM